MSLEKNNLGQEGEELGRDNLEKRVNSLLKDFPLSNGTEDDLKKGEDLLDAEMEKLSREDLINLAMGIRQRLEEPQSGFVDENMYLRFGTVYGAVCAQLEKLDDEEKR